jgi:NAD(P)-dependent dehydrogenase (short-subunit alcohol dehydrogenase family)
MMLEDKVSVVTGAGGGIGRAISVALARQGSSLVLVDSRKSEIEDARRELAAIAPKTEAFETDVTSETEVKSVVGSALRTFGTIDILVNCAGIYGPIGFVTDVDSEKWLETIHINLYGTFLFIKTVLPVMIRNKKGKIINMSGGGAVSPFPRFSAYSASKAAVVRLTETLAEEVKEYNIDINAIAPGAVNTRMLDEALAAGEAAGKDFMARAIKQKQEGGVPPDKVAELAVFLASPESGGLSGKLISLLWDKWKEIPQHLGDVMSSDVYAMRRIIPEDRGYNW